MIVPDLAVADDDGLVGVGCADGEIVRAQVFSTVFSRLAALAASVHELQLLAPPLRRQYPFHWGAPSLRPIVKHNLVASPIRRRCTPTFFSAFLGLNRLKGAWTDFPIHQSESFEFRYWDAVSAILDAQLSSGE